MIQPAPFAIGLLLLAVTLGCVMGSAALLVRRLLPGFRGYTWLVAFAVIATSELLAIHIVPGVLGVLARGTVLVSAGLALAGSLLVRPRNPSYDGPSASSSASEAWHSRVLAVAGLAIAGAFALAHFKGVVSTAPTDTDALSFHLPGVVRWLQSGSMWQFTQYLPLQAQGAYPNNGDVVLLASVLPFHSTVVVRLAMVPYLLLTGVGVYAIGRELAGPRGTSTLAAVAFMAIPATLYPVLFNVQTDAVMLACFSIGIFFLLRHRRTDARSDLILAGLALGIAFGTKWYGVSTVVAILALWATASYVARRDAPRVLRDLSVLVGLVALAGGFWLVRNLIDTGDPVFPVNVAPAGVTIFGAPPDVIRQQAGFSVASYFGSPHVLGHYIVPALWRTLGLSSLLYLVTTILAGVGLVATPRVRAAAGSDGGTLVVLAIGVLLLALVYSVTPYTALGPHNQPVQADANARYLVPAVVLAAGVTVGVASRVRTWRWLIEVALLAGILESVHRAFGLHVSGTVALVGVVIAAAAGAAPRLRQLRGRSIPGIGIGVAGALLLVIVLAFVQRHRFSDAAYRKDPVIAWLLTHSPSGRHIAIAGQWATSLSPVLPAFGPRFGNTVTYVGPVVRHMLHQYGTPNAFIDALRRGHYDLLIVGRAGDPSSSNRPASWARAAGYRPVIGSARLTLLAPAASLTGGLRS